MGNRGTVVFTDGKDSFSPAIYLHWNGGPESVLAFLDELDRRKIRADQSYEAARFVGIIAQFFDKDEVGGLSLGVVNGPASDSLEDLAKIYTDLGDNGVYLVDRTKTPTKIRQFSENYDWHDNDGTPPTVTMTEVMNPAWNQDLIDDYRREIGEFFQSDLRPVSQYG